VRLPTVAEAQTIASNNDASCGFPNPWTAWTATGVAGDATRAYFMSSAGVQSSQIIDNSPGRALCVSGTPQALHQILQRPMVASPGRSAKKY
jgi:beta-galactosidase